MPPIKQTAQWNDIFPSVFDEAAYMRDLNEQEKSGSLTFTKQHQEKNLSVLNEVKDLLPFDDIYKVNDCDLIYRFLIGRHWNVEEAAAGLRSYAEMRKKEKINEVLGESFPDDVLSITANVYGVDRKGFPVLWCCPEKQTVRSVFKDYSREDIVRAHFRQMEQARFCALSQKTDRCVYVLDAGKLSFTDVFSSSFVDFVKVVMNSLQSHYPEIMIKLIICNANILVTKGWSVLKHAVDPRIHEKLVFISKPPDPDVLAPYIDEMYILPQYLKGSTKKAVTKSSTRPSSSLTNKGRHNSENNATVNKPSGMGTSNALSEDTAAGSEEASEVPQEEEEDCTEVEDVMVRCLRIESERVAGYLQRGEVVPPLPCAAMTVDPAEEETSTPPEPDQEEPLALSSREEGKSDRQAAFPLVPPVAAAGPVLLSSPSSPNEKSVEESLFSVSSFDTDLGYVEVIDEGRKGVMAAGDGPLPPTSSSNVGLWNTLVTGFASFPAGGTERRETEEGEEETKHQYAATTRVKGKGKDSVEVTAGMGSLEAPHRAVDPMQDLWTPKYSRQGSPVPQRPALSSCSPIASPGRVPHSSCLAEDGDSTPWSTPPPRSTGLSVKGEGGSMGEAEKVVKVEGIATEGDRRRIISAFERCTKLVLTYTVKNKILCTYQGKSCAQMENSRVYALFPKEGIDNDDQDGMGILSAAPAAPPSLSNVHAPRRDGKNQKGGHTKKIAEEEEEGGLYHPHTGDFSQSLFSFPTRGSFASVEERSLEEKRKERGQPVSSMHPVEGTCEKLGKGCRVHDSQPGFHPSYVDKKESKAWQMGQVTPPFCTRGSEAYPSSLQHGVADPQQKPPVGRCVPTTPFSWMLSGELLHASGHYIHSTILVCDGERRVNFILKRSNFHRRIIVYMVVGNYREVQTTPDQMHYFPLNGKGPSASSCSSSNSFRLQTLRPSTSSSQKNDTPFQKTFHEGEVGKTHSTYGSLLFVKHASVTNPANSELSSSSFATTKTIEELTRASIHVGTVVPHRYSSRPVKKKQKAKDSEVNVPVISSTSVTCGSERRGGRTSTKEGKEAWIMLGTKAVVLQDSPQFWRRRFPSAMNRGVSTGWVGSPGLGGASSSPFTVISSEESRRPHLPVGEDHRAGHWLMPNPGGGTEKNPPSMRRNDGLHGGMLARSPSSSLYPISSSFSRNSPHYHSSGMAFFEPSFSSEGLSSVLNPKTKNERGGSVGCSDTRNTSSSFVKNTTFSSSTSLGSTVKESVRRVLPFFDDTTSVMIGEHRDQVLLFYGDLALWYQPHDLFALGAAITSLWVK